MDLPVTPPVAPMLARLVRDLPRDGLRYEPKWDGFRCLAFRDRDRVDLRSRHDRPFSRYFPEIVAAATRLPEPRYVLDGEVLVTRGGRYDFNALLERLHPSASRVARLAVETPAWYVAFDLLAVGDHDLRGRPYRYRRAELERLLAEPPAPLAVTPSVDDPDLAADWLSGGLPEGYDGVVAKPVDSVYQPGRRGWWKVKPERTADCVVAGFRLGTDTEVSSLLLGLYDGTGTLRHVGVASAFRREQRRELLGVLAPYVTGLAGHPWRNGFALEGGAMGRLPGSAGRWTPGMTQDWVPLRPVLVCEVAYDRPDGARFRHPARFRRWRPDRLASSCSIAQLVEARRT
ncbi:MAG TPA: ATP-dependent DNA ligase [Micromonosporaceae bacterium]